MANIWAVHNDPKIWDNPHIFDPNRFLSDDGKEVIKHEALMPFSIGEHYFPFENYWISLIINLAHKLRQSLGSRLSTKSLYESQAQMMKACIQIFT